MKYECDVIEDLLPLYQDGACTNATKRAVEEHLAECPKCTELFSKLKDMSIDEVILKEKENVIGSQSKYFKRKSALAGSIVGGIFALPILICLIVNLVTGHGLTWFFIVLAAMMIPTSLFVVPLVASKNRMFLTMTSLTGSIILLLAVCSIYSGGNWFFVAATAVLFGLTVCFAPFIACRRPVKQYLGNRKGLTVMAAYTVTYFLMMICIGWYVKIPGYFSLMFTISIPLVLMTWIMFLIIRYLPANGLVKAGVCIMALSAVSYFGTEAILYLMLKSADATSVQVYGEPSILTMIVGIGIGVIFTGIGLLTGKSKME
ncbi:MAG: zf-HC2 domain-containing protein [Lachnospiraceae bacterium]|nr:zf-HC2 domain-containing protein [Lachnospiraceae bacterium]MBR4606100.1 zf-HC2 domain-containing protein [Lachnospiraceae bacterium]MBR6151084.1 zf-HC2 domain-containing protein [Lachnospiraceae bacterium]